MSCNSVTEIVISKQLPRCSKLCQLHTELVTAWCVMQRPIVMLGNTLLPPKGLPVLFVTPAWQIRVL